MRVAVVGSRTFDDYKKLSFELGSLHIIEESSGGISLIVSGGARGADSMGERWAKENGVETLIFLPDWKKYGRSAGFRRNKDIVENCDVLVAFWDGQSRGTKHSIDLAREMGKEVHVVYFDQPKAEVPKRTAIDINDLIPRKDV